MVLPERAGGWSEWLETQRRRLIVRELTAGTGRIIWHGRKA